MAEFINLDEQEQETLVLPNYPNSINNITPDTKVVDGVIDKEEVEGICADYSIITIDKINSVDTEEEDEEHICIKDGCDISKYYGCANGDDGFQKDNLFSELTDEYQRAVARINLGIADEYALKWGNIKGNLSNQKDLYTFVTDSIAFDVNKLIDEINLKLAQWAYDIKNQLDTKASIYSPEFTGAPATTLPLITDNSNRIASTEWVNAKIASASIDDNIKGISITPEFMCYGDNPTDVKIVWEYQKDVIEQSINGNVIDPKLREYTFINVTTSMVVTLKYKYEDINAAKLLVFDIKYPIYYGTSPDYTTLNRTIDNVFTVTANTNQYIYVMIPNGSNSTIGVSSMIGGFRLLGTQVIFSNTYYIYKSAQTSLGETTIEVFNQSGYNQGDDSATTIRELLAAKADKHTVYTKEEVDDKISAIEDGGIELTNYYTKSEVDSKIPDISNKANKSEIPTKVSELDNDLEFLTEVPSNYITESKLNSKGYLTQELEPLFVASAAKTINQQDITNWNNKVDKESGMGLSEESYSILEKAKLAGLSNYNDTAVRQLIANLDTEIKSKANSSDIPDISGKADKIEIPTKVSQLANDSSYISSLPTNLITSEILEAKGYLTEFIETDPTVPSWAKEDTKPSYTLEELGAESAGSAASALFDSKLYTDNRFNLILSEANPSYSTFKLVGDAIVVNNTAISNINNSIGNINTTLTTKADKSELFSKNYNDLINLPSIPNIAGLASELWVTQQIAAIPATDLSNYALKTEIPDVTIFVEKENGKVLSTNDFNNIYKDKLDGLQNYNDLEITASINSINDTLTELNVDIPYDMYISTNPSTYYSDFEDAISFMEKLCLSKVITTEYSNNDYLTSYNKIGIDSTDINNIRTIKVEIYSHYSNNQNLKMVFNLLDGDTKTFTYTKEFIPIVINDLTSSTIDVALSAAQGKILMDKITELESRINEITTNAL